MVVQPAADLDRAPGHHVASVAERAGLLETGWRPRSLGDELLSADSRPDREPVGRGEPARDCGEGLEQVEVRLADVDRPARLGEGPPTPARDLCPLQPQLRAGLRAQREGGQADRGLEAGLGVDALGDEEGWDDVGAWEGRRGPLQLGHGLEPRGQEGSHTSAGAGVEDTLADDEGQAPARTEASKGGRGEVTREVAVALADLGEALSVGQALRLWDPLTADPGRVAEDEVDGRSARVWVEGVAAHDLGGEAGVHTEVGGADGEGDSGRVASEGVEVAAEEGQRKVLGGPSCLERALPGAAEEGSGSDGGLPEGLGAVGVSPLSEVEEGVHEGATGVDAAASLLGSDREAGAEEELGQLGRGELAYRELLGVLAGEGGPELGLVPKGRASDGRGAFEGRGCDACPSEPSLGSERLEEVQGEGSASLGDAAAGVFEDSPQAAGELGPGRGGRVPRRGEEGLQGWIRAHSG